MDVTSYNQRAWDAQVAKKNRWTTLVDSSEIESARAGDVRIVLTPEKPVPGDWLSGLAGANVLCLAGGGGQQAPVLAAAGASVTVLDNSPAQLEQDCLVAQREQLTIRTVVGDMCDLSEFPDDGFDLIVHPCSNSFVADVRKVWTEAFRVLVPGGRMLSGFSQPTAFLFDYEAMRGGVLDAKYPIPYSDLDDLPAEELQRLIDAEEPLCYGHTLEDQLGGQTEAGFQIAGFYEDAWHSDEAYKHLSRYISPFAATLAVKPV